MSTDKTCATCASWSPRDSGGMAKHRMAVCLRGPKWRFYPPQSTCPKHEAAPASVVQARAAWLAKGEVLVLQVKEATR
jgi:hypothetical protein